MSESDDSLTTLCLELVSTGDRDRYLTAMAAPRLCRNSLMALYAFNVDVAQICESVSESILGEIRFQWWRDQITGAFADGPRPAGVAGALHDTIRTHDLSQHLFTHLLDSRMRDLEQIPPQTLDDLIAYCEGTSSTLIDLSMEILSGQRSEKDGISDVSHHTGIAWALCGLIRAIPYHTAHGRCYIPQQMLRDAGIQWEYLHHDANKTLIAPLLEKLAVTAEDHLSTAGHLAGEIPPHAIASVFVIPMARHYLAVLRKAEFDPYDVRVQQSHSVSKTLRLMWAAWRKRV